MGTIIRNAKYGITLVLEKNGGCEVETRQSVSLLFSDNNQICY